MGTALGPRSSSSVPAVDGILGASRGAAVGSALQAAPLAATIDAVRNGAACTRPEIVAASGMSRKVVTQRVEQALELGLLEEGELAPSGGGRQARTLRFRHEAGRVFAVLLGASEITVAVADLNGDMLETLHEDWSVAAGPEATMERVQHHLETLAHRTGSSRPWGIGVGVPGPVEYSTGRLVAPPIMPGWDGFSPRSWLREHYDAPVWVDNDVNLMAIGEWSRGAAVDGRDLLFLKAGTGVGAGHIANGRLLRGQRGGAGDIGHTHVSDDPSMLCRCGRTGCLEAVASGWSLLASATERVAESPLLRQRLGRRGNLMLGDLGEAAGRGDALVLELLEGASRTISDVAAGLINFTNPGLVVIGGGVLRTGPRFLEILHEVVEQRCTDLVIDSLEIRAASLDHLEGVIGAGLLAVENLLEPPALARWVESGSPLGHAAAIQRHALAFS